jgi:hypothetical protein
MGRANARRRKGSTHEHLPKVGSTDELSEEGRRERAAVMDVMGLGRLSEGGRNALFVVAALVLVAAIIGLVILTALN